MSVGDDLDARCWRSAAMSILVEIAVVGTAVAIVVALFAVLWREHVTRHQAIVATVSGGVLALWLALNSMLARRGALEPPSGNEFPPFGIAFLLALVGLSLCLGLSPTLRSLLSRQPTIIRLHMWRFLGLFAFLSLMFEGLLPSVFALPAGIGDGLIAATAPWVARGIASPQGRRRAIVWNWLGVADLVVAISLGMMTSPGPAHVLNVVPSSVVLTQFPMALIPTFLVPLALTLHGVSLWQLYRRSWVRPLEPGREGPSAAPQLGPA
jgi:hypothetical protein